MVTTAPSFIELTWGTKVATHVKGLAHKCSTDPGDYYFTVIILEELDQDSSNKTNPLSPRFFPSILNVSRGPSGFSAGSYFQATFWLPQRQQRIRQLPSSLLILPIISLFPFPSDKQSRLQICKDNDGLCGNVFLIFQMCIAATVMKCVQYVIYFKELGILNQNLWQKCIESISTASLSPLCISHGEGRDTVSHDLQDSYMKWSLGE